MAFPFTLMDLIALGGGAGLVTVLGISMIWLTRGPALTEQTQELVSVAPRPRATVRERSHAAAVPERSRVAA